MIKPTPVEIVEGLLVRGGMSPSEAKTTAAANAAAANQVVATNGFKALPAFVATL